MSEFGACYGSEVCAREITQVADECDKVLAGWAYWQFKIYKDLTTTAGAGSEGFYNSDGSLQHAKVKALARTYVQRTQGTLLSMTFNSDTASFEAVFILDTSIEAPTEIYLNQEYWYHKQYEIQILSHNSGQVINTEIKNTDDRILSFQLSASQQASGSQVRILLSKKSNRNEDALKTVIELI